MDPRRFVPCHALRSNASSIATIRVSNSARAVMLATLSRAFGAGQAQWPSICTRGGRNMSHRPCRFQKVLTRLTLHDEWTEGAWPGGHGGVVGAPLSKES